MSLLLFFIWMVWGHLTKARLVTKSWLLPPTHLVSVGSAGNIQHIPDFSHWCHLCNCCCLEMVSIWPRLSIVIIWNSYSACKAPVLLIFLRKYIFFFIKIYFILIVVQYAEKMWGVKHICIYCFFNMSKFFKA